MAEFANNAIKSPFQDGHYIYTVIAGSGSGTSSIAPIIYVADLESPRSFNKNLQPLFDNKFEYGNKNLHKTNAYWHGNPWKTIFLDLIGCSLILIIK